MFRCPGPDAADLLAAGHRCGIQPGRQCQLGQSRMSRDHAARLAQMLQTAQRGDRQSGHRIQLRIITPVCRKDSKSDFVLAGQFFNLLQTIGPVRCAADQPDQNPFCRRQGFFNIGIHRNRMFQSRQIGQTQGREIIPLKRITAMPAFSKRPQITVRKRQHNKISPGLIQVCGNFCFL